jgi:putative restriction endonuclease
MRYWWVNQNQTHRQEIGGGYLWSPKRNANSARNPFYESMREVAPGDLIFSFVDARIMAIGIAASYCYESPKPAEFGHTGMNWDTVGWRVRVRFTRLLHQIKPKDHMARLRDSLPGRYSPLRPNGDGLQGVYRTEVPPIMAELLVQLIGPEAFEIAAAAERANGEISTQVGNPDIEMWERHLEQEVEQDSQIDEAERSAIVMARRGQGLFKDRVRGIERRCRITAVENLVHLRASHLKPWRDATNEERLDGENGLLLTPSIDHLLDKGFISFENSGELIISPVAHKPSLERMGVATNRVVNVGSFTEGQRNFLNYHRDAVLLQAVRL